MDAGWDQLKLFSSMKYWYETRARVLASRARGLPERRKGQRKNHENEEEGA